MSDRGEEERQDVGAEERRAAEEIHLQAPELPAMRALGRFVLGGGWCGELEAAVGSFHRPLHLQIQGEESLEDIHLCS